MTSRSTAWKNPSVLQFANGQEPISAVMQAAQDLVLRAIEAGWSGPPYDPIALAALMKIAIRPTSDVQDARTTSGPDGGLIEFNPNRPKRRVRFSIAHELAHLLFPDWNRQVRYRSSIEGMRHEDRELEALCNIAAAEFLMPIGSFEELSRRSFDMRRLLDLREKFEVSTEAILLRSVKLSSEAVFAFAAARNSNGPYQLEYAISSKHWRTQLKRGNVLPTESVIRDCTAIGYTAGGYEVWPRVGRVRIECVGVPSLNNTTTPVRVLGIGWPTVDQDSNPKLRFVLGDATEPRGTGKKVIAHVVNDLSPNWGRGFGFALRERYPQVQRGFRKWVETHKSDFRLGRIRVTPVSHDLMVAHLICQHGFGASKYPRLRYGYLRDCLNQLALEAREFNATIHMPLIGTGEGGGAWSIVRELIEETLCSRGLFVTAYELPGQLPNRQGSLTFQIQGS